MRHFTAHVLLLTTALLLLVSLAGPAMAVPSELDCIYVSGRKICIT